MPDINNLKVRSIYFGSWFLMFMAAWPHMLGQSIMMAEHSMGRGSAVHLLVNRKQRKEIWEEAISSYSPPGYSLNDLPATIHYLPIKPSYCLSIKILINSLGQSPDSNYLCICYLRHTYRYAILVFLLFLLKILTVNQQPAIFMP
jgi:hypothetical protein